MRENPKRIHYWGAATEAAIIEFNNAEDQESREAIYNEKLHAPFCKMVENIVNRFKFSYIGESYESVHNDALGHLVKNIHKFSPSKGKSFGYASVVVKNYLIQRNNECYKRHNREVSIVEYDDPEYEEHFRNGGDVAVLSCQPKSYDVKEFVALLVAWWQLNINKVFHYEYERQIARAVLQIMIDIPEVIVGKGGTGKKDFFKVLRELTGKKSPHIGRVVRTMAKRYPILQRRYIENGCLLRKRVSKARQFGQGSKNPESKLNEAQAVEIRKLYEAGERTQKEIGRMFGVNDSVVSSIIRGRAWKHTLPEGFTSHHSYHWRGNNKLTEAQVSDIRKRLQEGIKDTELAAMYGVTDRAIRKIRRGDAWKHLLPPSPVVPTFQGNTQLPPEPLLLVS